MDALHADVIGRILEILPDSRPLGLTCSAFYEIYSKIPDALVYKYIRCRLLKWNAIAATPVKLRALFDVNQYYSCCNIDCLIAVWGDWPHLPEVFLRKIFRECKESKLGTHGGPIAEWLWAMFSRELIKNNEVYLAKIVRCGHIALVEKIINNVTCDYFVWNICSSQYQQFSILRNIYDRMCQESREEALARTVFMYLPTGTITYLSMRGEKLIARDIYVFAHCIFRIRAVMLYDVVDNYESLCEVANTEVLEWLKSLKRSSH